MAGLNRRMSETWPQNPGDKRARLLNRTNTHRVGLACHAHSLDVNIVVTDSESTAGIKSYSGVE